jgi:hypothetical protein
MAAESATTFWALPFSGDVAQDYHPITSWFRSVSTQLGFINIKEMQSDNPDLEKRIVSEVGSYGKQLGRIVEALHAICEHLDTGRWAPDEQEAVKSFKRLAEEIDAFKGANQPVTKATIDHLVSALRSLRSQDRLTYERVQEELRVE